MIDSKNFVFYPAIIASICWSVFSLFKISSYIEFLKSEAPECTMKNENREIIFFMTILTLSLI